MTGLSGRTKVASICKSQAGQSGNPMSMFPQPLPNSISHFPFVNTNIYWKYSISRRASNVIWLSNPRSRWSELDSHQDARLQQHCFLSPSLIVQFQFYSSVA